MFYPLDKNDYYRVLNYPSVPNDIIEECLSLIDAYKKENDHKFTFGLSKYNRLDKTPASVKDFCNRYLSETKFTYVFVQWFDNGYTIPAHRDHIYDQQINCYISNQSTATSFYEPIANFSSYETRGKYVDMKDLIEIDSIVFPKNTWILFNARSLHGVKEIDGMRAMISLKLSDKFST